MYLRDSYGDRHTSDCQDHLSALTTEVDAFYRHRALCRVYMGVYMHLKDAHGNRIHQIIYKGIHVQEIR